MSENKRYKLWRELDLDGHTEDWAIEIEGFDEVICEEEVVNLLNQQDMRIKELELYVEMLKQVKPLRKLPKSIKVYCEKVNDDEGVEK